MSQRYQQILAYLAGIQPLLNTLSEQELMCLMTVMSEDDISEAHDISERVRVELHLPVNRLTS